MKNGVFATFLALIAALPLSAAVTLPGIFSDHAVLAKKPVVPVFGKAAPGEKVVVEFERDDDLDTFVERHFADGFCAKDGSTIRTCKLHNYYYCRFVDGIWMSTGDANIYHNSMYDSYHHMIYDPKLDVECMLTEVGDLL